MKYMKYEEFKNKASGFPLITGEYLKLFFGASQVINNQLMRWQKNGKIIKLRRNIYMLNADDRKINPSRLFIAGEIYKPSYVSMEYALSFYGLIPEKTADITSITTKKTSVFENIYGRFVYQHIKIECFTGFVEAKDEAGLIYYIAVPEKALVDFIYLNLKRFTGNFQRILAESFRLQNTDILNEKKMFNYAKLFKCKKLMEITSRVKQ